MTADEIKVLFERHFQEAVRYARHLGCREEVAAEIAQNVFIALMESRKALQFPNEAASRTYIFNWTRWRVSDYRRRQMGEQHVADDLASSHTRDPRNKYAGDPARLYEFEQTRAVLEESAGGQSLLLRLQGHEWDEIDKMRGVGRGASKMAFHRMRRVLLSDPGSERAQALRDLLQNEADAHTTLAPLKVRPSSVVEV